MKPVLRSFLALTIIVIAFACKPDPIIEPPVVVVDEPYGTPFDSVPAPGDIVMYEVNLRAFSPEGDIQGVIDNLGHIKSLGVNVIWLMPIHPVGQINSVNSPYSVQNYKAIAEEYGLFSDLRKLTDEAHKKNMAIIMDWVANHTAWDNAWISSKDWYTQDASGNIIHPAGTNWQDVADLNFENIDMQNAMIAAMKYWVWETNIDGYRCDYADGVPLDFWKRALDTLLSIPNKEYIFLAEGSRDDHFDAGFGLKYGWNFYSRLISIFDGVDASGLYSTHLGEYTTVPAGKHILRYTTNHDESAWNATPIDLFNGKEGSLAALVAAVYMGGAPLIYGSQEVGSSETIPFFSNTSIDWDANPDMLQTYKDIMKFYTGSDASRKGTITNYNDSDVICFKKTLDTNEVLILINVRNSNLDFDIPADLQSTNWTDAISNDEVALAEKLAMGPYEFFIASKK